MYVLHALRQVEPERFSTPLAMLRQPGVDPVQMALPGLLNELWVLDRPLTLVLDDFHEITDTDCHESLRFLLRRLPPTFRLVIATRSDPPLGLAALRARGDLAELRAAELRFTEEEAESLLNHRLSLGLSADDLRLLGARTEGWAAGLYLAGLSLRDRPDVSSFVAGFTGQHHHLVDYLGDDVLARLPGDERDFLLHTSILDELTAPLCDAVTMRTGAAQRLTNLERTNQFLVPLDGRRERYRYHQLFRELLHVELRWTAPELEPELHRRAAKWYQQSGNAHAAMRHAYAAEDYCLAGELFLVVARDWVDTGRITTAVDWVAQLPEKFVIASPLMTLIAACASGLMKLSPEVMERSISLVEGRDFTGPFFFGEPSLGAAVALVRAAFPVDDVGRALAAAEAAIDSIDDPDSHAFLIAQVALGQNLYLAGRPVDAERALTNALDASMAEHRPLIAIYATALLALLRVAQGDGDHAERLSQRAVNLRTAVGLNDHPALWLTDVASGTVLARLGRLEEADAILTACIELHREQWQRWPLTFTVALLALAPVRFARGQAETAGSLLEEARAAIAGCTDPGMLPVLLAEAERGLQRPPRHITGLRDDLSEGELRILRLLASNLSQREIGQELYLSVNTIKTHTRGIYTKLDVVSRSEAVSRARVLGLIA
jgi:LuxR family maltose regulon positive regulatory protein